MADPEADKTVHTLKSSNLPFYGAIWDAAKASRGLIALHKRFYWDHTRSRNTKREPQRRSALVDVVAEDGQAWIKVSTMSEQRLSLELAKAQWEAADSSDEASDKDESRAPVADVRIESHGDMMRGDAVDRVELVRMAYDLRRASQAHRIHYAHPRVTFVLPKIPDPPAESLSLLLDRIRSTGAVVELGPNPVKPKKRTTSSSSIAEMFPRLLPARHPPLTETLNVDCTILLALVSDLSHITNHPIEPEYNVAIKRQIDLESREHLLPASLWPGMAGRKLISTEEAVNRMWEIVDTIATPSERARTELITNQRRLIGDLGLLAEMQQYSDYPIPSNLYLPIVIVPGTKQSEIEAAVEEGRLPEVSRQVASELSDINRSVFMYGWLHNHTTISSNRTVAKTVEGIIEKHGKEEDGGPVVWLSEPARSLLGKEKERRR